MSDFLTRLAERALGQAPLAQPWIAFRFAKGPDLAVQGPGLLPPEATAPEPAARPEVEEVPAVWRRLLETPQQAAPTQPPASAPVPGSWRRPRGGAR